MIRSETLIEYIKRRKVASALLREEENSLSVEDDVLRLKIDLEPPSSAIKMVIQTKFVKPEWVSIMWEELS